MYQGSRADGTAVQTQPPEHGLERERWSGRLGPHARLRGRRVPEDTQEITERIEASKGQRCAICGLTLPCSLRGPAHVSESRTVLGRVLSASHRETNSLAAPRQKDHSQAPLRKNIRPSLLIHRRKSDFGGGNISVLASTTPPCRANLPNAFGLNTVQYRSLSMPLSVFVPVGTSNGGTKGMSKAFRSTILIPTSEV